MAESDGERDYSLRIFRPLAQYVRDNLAPEALTAAARAGTVSEEDLLHGGLWVSHRTVEVLLAEYRRVLGSNERFTEASAYQLTEGYGPLLVLIRATSPDRVYARVARESSAVTRVASFAVRPIGPRRIDLVHTSTVDESRLLCLVRQAQTAALPTAWGLPPATLLEKACVCWGDAACVYELSWLEVPRLGPQIAGATVGSALALGLALWGAPAGFLWLLLPVFGWIVGAHYEQKRVHRSHLREVTQVERAVREISAEEALARGQRVEAEGAYRRIVENAFEGIWALDAEGKTTFANGRMEELLGCTLAGAHIRDFVSDEHRAALDAALAGSVGQRATPELLFCRADGAAVWLRSHVSPLRGTPGGLGFFTDVTEGRAARAALAASETRFSAILERSEDVVVLRDAAGGVTWVSPSMHAVLGYAPSRLEEAPTHPDDAPGLLALVRSLQPGECRHTTVRLRHLDGRWLWFEGSVTHLLDEPAVSAMVSSFRDVTARRALEEQLRHTQRMESVGQLAGGVAHDFNNLLTVILGYSEILLPSFDPAGPVHRDLREIEGAALRAKALTRQLLAFSRKQVLAPVVVDLHERVRGVASMLRRLIGEHIAFEIRTAPDLHAVRVDPGQIEQVLMNLAVNARDAMPNGGTLTIETSNAVLDATSALEHSEATPGPYVLLAVSDTGVGMDAATCARAFEPFFTTKEAGKGTGLGLSTVFGIVRQSGGTVRLVSEPGLGSTFKLYFPAVPGIVSRPAPSVPVAPPARHGGTETVLVVEDEAQLRVLACRILRGAGYQVLDAANPADALALAEQEVCRIDLLLTDMVMPGMSGRQLAEKLALSRPEMKVLYVSGYTDDSVVHRGILHGGMAFLQKPFTPTTLAAKVRQVLGPA